MNRGFLYWAILVAIMCAKNGAYAQLKKGSFIFEGLLRNYEVYLPKDYKPDMPLVISLHGYTETIEWYKNYTLLHEVTDTAGFITVYPAAIGKSWNSGLIAPGWPYIDTTVNDVGFISALIDTLEAYYDIDMSRVYCCGYSLGGEMTYKLAGELGYRFAAVASITGLINENSAKTCNPVRPFPIIQMHGTLDTYETWNGDNKNLWTVPQTINFWINKNGCSLPGDTVSLPDLDPGDGCTVEKISYTDCSELGCFILYKINKGGHHWPDAAFNWGGGYLNRDINANVEILNFFKNYENPLVNLAYAKSVEINPFHDQSLGDPLTIRSRLSNPENHAATVWAIIQDEQSQFVDSLQLFDDGMHGDDGASDNIWANMKSIQELSEEFYKVDIITHDNHFSDIQDLLCLSPAHFTIIGPIFLESYSIVSSDTVLDPGDRLNITVTLKNDGSTLIAPDIKAKLTSLDESVSVSAWNRIFGDMAAGESSTSDYYRVTIDDEWTGNSQVPILVEISSNNYVYWKDTLVIPGITDMYTIDDPGEQTLWIYPNPTNNLLNIKIRNTGKQKLEVAILDITGKLIYQKECRSIDAHFAEQIDLSGYAKGIYLIKVKQHHIVYVGKVIVR